MVKTKQRKLNLDKQLMGRGKSIYNTLSKLKPRWNTLLFSWSKLFPLFHNILVLMTLLRGSVDGPDVVNNTGGGMECADIFY